MPDYIHDLAQSIGGKLDGVGCEMVFRDTYDIVLNHANINSIEEKTFGSVLARESEMVYEFTDFKNTMEDYVNNRIHDLFGLTYLEFISLPVHYKNKMVEYAFELNKDRNTKQDAINNELAALAKS